MASSPTVRVSELPEIAEDASASLLPLGTQDRKEAYISEIARMAVGEASDVDVDSLTETSVPAL